MARIKVKNMEIEISAKIGNADYTDLLICDILSAFSDSLMDAVYSDMENKRERTRNYIDGFIDYFNEILEDEKVRETK